MCDRGQSVLSLKVTHTGISLVTSLSQSSHLGVRVKLGNGVSRGESGFEGLSVPQLPPGPGHVPLPSPKTLTPGPCPLPSPPDADPLVTGAPGAPMDVHCHDANRDYVIVSWKPPNTTKESPVIGYFIDR